MHGKSGRWMTVAGVLMLAACGPSPDASAPANGSTAKPKVEHSEYSRRLAALNDEQRNAVFFRAIREAGLQCQAVTQSEPAMPDNRYPTWRAHCGDTSAHLLQIMPDGTANIISRSGP